MSGTQESGRHDEQLPDRFDERVELEIEDGADRERPVVRMRDAVENDAWVTAEIDAVVSLSEHR
ncbi:hypothetical protein [Halomicrococcus gelatinilyticus]|uniref:hypothetical protein n=1 Tax=Halomicrococcus gelatinilyticus TaxID=1702103 RepID=UPI002E12549E